MKGDKVDKINLEEEKLQENQFQKKEEKEKQ